MVFKGGYGKYLSKKLQKNALVQEKKIFVCCDDKAWCSKEVMNYWSDNIWNSYDRGTVKNALILDDYSVHKIEEIKTKLESHNTLLFYIPGGLTRFLHHA